jgi:hypothetical protein
MRKSTGDLVWDFIVLCNDRKMPKNLHEYEKFIHHCSDKSVIEKQSVNIDCRFRAKSSWLRDLQAMSSELQAPEDHTSTCSVHESSQSLPGWAEIGPAR